jgi:hypothetical protein
MPDLTTRELQDLILLARNIQWRYQLDQYEEEALQFILRAVRGAERTVLAGIQARGPGLTEWSEQRSIALLDELSDLTLGLRVALTNDIADITAHAGAASYLTHNNIVSFDGMVSPFVSVALSAGQVRSLVLDTPVGGNLLQDWVERTFDRAMIAGIKEEILTGRLLGESYPELVTRITAGFGMVERDAISLVRTYVQSANVGAMEAIYQANREVVKGVQWVATMEVGGSRGRGTCLRCAALDGQKFAWNEERPPCPMHIRCRCVLIAVMLSWRELGLDIDDMEERYRPWTRRPDMSIDAGRPGGTILEHGFHQGNFASWFARLSSEDQLSIVGPGRFGLLRSGTISFGDLANRSTGRLRLLDRDSSGRIIGLRGLESSRSIL